MSLLMTAWSFISSKVGLVLSGMVFVVLVFLKGRSEGREDAEHEQQEIDAEARDRRDAARRDAEQSDTTDSLRDGNF